VSLARGPMSLQRSDEGAGRSGRPPSARVEVGSELLNFLQSALIKPPEARTLYELIRDQIKNRRQQSYWLNRDEEGE
jgi:hypothetical protein